MGRKFLMTDNISNVLHPFLPLSLLIAGIVATFALISSFCALKRKRPPTPIPSQRKSNEFEIETLFRNDKKPTEEAEALKSEPPTPAVAAVESDGTDEVAPPLPLPPPPGKIQLSGSMSYHNRSTSSVLQGKSFFSTMSMKVQGIGAMSRKHVKGDKVLNHEDSILKKKIILGEKCRVPDDDDTILLDDRGNRISSYHPRMPSSLPVSRQTSFIDPDAVQGSTSAREK